MESAVLHSKWTCIIDGQVSGVIGHNLATKVIGSKVKCFKLCIYKRKYLFGSGIVK